MNVEKSLPAHDEETVEAIAALHAKHEREISRSQRLANRVVGFMSSDAAMIWLTAFVTLWLVYNLVFASTGHVFDHPPFSALQTVLAGTGLYVTLIILRTQRHDDEVAKRRERLTLQLSIVADRKAAKIIALLEELRLESPFLADRRDDEASAMSVPTDPHAVVDALGERERRGDSDDV